MFRTKSALTNRRVPIRGGMQRIIQLLLSFSLLASGLANGAVIQFSGDPTTTATDSEIYFSPKTGEVSTALTGDSQFGVSNAFGALALAFNALPDNSLVVSPLASDPSLLSVARLTAGTLIGAPLVFDNTEFILAESMGILGNWNDLRTDYFGFRFQDVDGVHYGWANITVLPDFNVTLNSFAYETEAGVGIIAGAAAVPEPSSIAMVLIALSGLFFAIRRRRAPRAVATAAVGIIAVSVGLNAQTTQYAGEEDPIGKRLMQFRSDYYWSALPPSSNGWSTERMWAPVFGDNPYSVGLQLPLYLNPGFEPGRQHSSVSGRFVTPNNDHAVKVFTYNNLIYANFFNTNGGSDVNFGTPLPRFTRTMPDNTTTPTVDFIAAAAGDVDRHVDTSGNFHDEIAIAFVSSDNNVKLAVLDYSNNLMDDNGNVTLQTPTVTIVDTGLTFDPTQMAGPNDLSLTNPQTKILPVDNVLSVAIGDFDGDQSGEIALAYVSGAQSVVVQTWRYRWGSPSSIGLIGSQTLAPIQQTGSAGVIGPGAMGANLTLASGDFYGTGTDQLAIGWLQWKHDDFNPILDIPMGKWAVAPRFVVNVMSASSQQLSLNVTASPGYPTFLTLDDTSKLPLIPQRITITNAPSSWNVLNGTWDVFVTGDNKLQIALDSTALPTNLAGSIQVSASNPLVLPSSAQPLVIDPKNWQGSPSATSSLDYNIKWGVPKLQLVSGLFKFDANTFTFSRRQLATIYSMPQICNMQDGPGTPVECRTDMISEQTWALNNNFYSLTSDNLGAATFNLENGFLLNAPSPDDYCWGQWVATAGAFRGTSTIGADGTAIRVPTWQVAITVPYNFGSVQTYIQELDNGNVNSAVVETVNLNAADNQMKPGLVNFDPMGNSLFLGAPVKFSSSQMYTPLTILQEPPKHLAWIKGAMVNINRGDGFTVQLTSSTGTTISTAATTTHDSTFTQTHTVSAGGSVKLNLIPGFEDTTSLQDTAKFEFDKSENEENYTKGSSSYTYSDTAVTNHDDYIRAQTQDLNIWRYRVFGAKGNSGNSLFYDLTFPGPIMDAPGPALPVEWYNPVHENGNALSYPPQPVSGLPDDVGPAYTVNTQVPPGLNNGVMYSDNGFCLGGTSSAPTITLTGVTDAGQSIGTSKTNSWDNDTKVSTDFKLGIFGGNASYEGEFGQKQSWSSTKSSDSSTTGSTTITYNVDFADDSNNYRTFPVVYNSNAGVLKFIHYVEIPTTAETSICDSGANFWTDNYGGAPDLALNLPFRFNWVSYNKSTDTTTWELNPKITREKMKGFFIQSPTASELEGADVYPPMSSNPPVGSTVRLAARVYNYSVGANPASNVVVTFYAQPYDDERDNEIGCGVPVTGTTGQVCASSTRILLGSTTIASLPSWGVGQQNWVEVGYNWTIPSNFISTYQTDSFRIYVQITYPSSDPSQIEINPPQVPCVGDPAAPTVCKDMVTDSTQPGWDATKPGQNNEGWGLITLSPASSTTSTSNAQLVGVTDQMTPIVRRSLKTVPDSLAGIDSAGKLKTGLMTVYLGSNVRFRVKGVGEVTAFDNEQHAMVYDGTGKNRKLIAGTILHGARTTGTHGWFEWRADTLGLHQLTLVLPEPSDDPNKGDNIAKLSVLVIRNPADVNGDGQVDTRDVSMIEKETGKSPKTSACGAACDLNGDGLIGTADIQRIVSECDHGSCQIGQSSFSPKKMGKE